MGLRDILNDHPEDEAAQIAINVWPNPYRGENGWQYRHIVLKQFLKRSGAPRKQMNGRRYRSENETRLDRAWVDIAEAVDRDSATVRDVVLRMYDGNPAGHIDVTHRFLADLITIEERLQKGKSQD